MFVTSSMDPSHKPLSISMLVYLKYGPKYTLFVGAILYMSTPATGGGPVNPVVVGVAIDAIPSIPSEYPAVCGGKPGEARGVLPNAGDAKGFAKVLAGDIGSFRFKGVGPLGNSHCVDCVGR